LIVIAWQTKKKTIEIQFGIHEGWAR